MAEITVGSYLFERVKQLGIKSVFGVPGDYELVLLDMVPGAGLTWRGSPNELNASYAADGYARVNGCSAFVSTFGPGELSAYCGVAGQYTEFVPSVHIVGYPAAKAQADHLIMHHSLGDGKFGMYHEMTKNISVSSTVINYSQDAAEEIDRVLNDMIYYSRPVYIGLAVDVITKKISSEKLKSPLTTVLTKNDSQLEADVVSKIMSSLKAAKSPIIIVDGMAIRNGVQAETVDLIKAANIPYFTTSMSKGFTENLHKYGGTYGGLASVKELQESVEASDCVLWIGSFSSDFNTGEFTERVKPDIVVDFQRFFTLVGSTKHDLKMKHMLPALTKALTDDPLPHASSITVSWNPYPLDHPERPAKLTQDYLWPTLGRYLRSGDFIITETGTSAYGFPGCNIMSLPDVRSFSQTVFGSIGFATGAAVGAFVAGKEDGSIKRGILVTGEGSLQLTVQAFSDILRHDLNATVFLLNNDGYTIERLIHGPEEPYNTVPVWDYSKLGALFGPTAKFEHYAIKTPDELDALLADEAFNEPTCTRVVELFLPRLDAPMVVKRITEAVEQFNKAKH